MGHCMGADSGDGTRPTGSLPSLPALLMDRMSDASDDAMLSDSLLQLLVLTSPSVNMLQSRS